MVILLFNRTEACRSIEKDKPQIALGYLSDVLLSLGKHTTQLVVDSMIILTYYKVNICQMLLADKNLDSMR